MSAETQGSHLLNCFLNYVNRKRYLGLAWELKPNENCKPSV